MRSSPPTPATSPHPGVGGREFVLLVAAMMSIGALAIDIMLPALPAIASALEVRDANSIQWVLAAYTYGFGASQLIWGPLTDRFGRKPILGIALTGFVVASVAAALASSFAMLIVARTVQGMFAASTRVLVTSVVRDCYSGRAMARVMSLAQFLFFAVPILAPSIGAALLLVGPWELNFWALALLSLGILLWTGARLPETLPPERRRAISPASLMSAWSTALGNRYSLGYAIAQAMLFGALLGYLNSSEQVIGEVFDARHRFPLIFATIAAAMGSATLLNATLVERFGARKLSHGALIGVIVVGAVHLAVAVSGNETLVSFVALQALQLAMSGLIGANFSAMAMEEVGHIAGTAASVQGTITNLGGATLGILIGQAYDRTTVPVAAGFLVAGLAALAIVLIVERGRLFVPYRPSAPA